MTSLMHSRTEVNQICLVLCHTYVQRTIMDEEGSDLLAQSLARWAITLLNPTGEDREFNDLTSFYQHVELHKSRLYAKANFLGLGRMAALS